MDKPFVDFAAVKELVSIIDVIPLLSLSMKGAASQLRGPCPVCKGDPRALAINTDKEGFYCHARGKGGDVIALTAHVRGTSQREAALFLQEHFGGPVRKPEPRKGRKTVPAAPSATSDLTTDHPAIELLGLSVAACEALGIGYSEKDDRLVIPLRLPDGTDVGNLGIAMDENLAPLLLFPNDLEERCNVTAEEAAPPKTPADQLRKLLRVV